MTAPGTPAAASRRLSAGTFPAFATLLAAAFLASCSGLPPQRAAGGPEPASPRMFWTVAAADGNPGRGTLYVQGTLHAGTKELYPLDGRVLGAMAASDIVLAELSPDGMAAAQGLVLDRMASSALPGGATLRALLTPEDTAKAEAIMGAAVFDSLAVYEPWVAYSVLDQFAVARARLDPALGVDAALFAEAARLGKTVMGLETADDQLRLLCGPGLELQALILRDSIREYRDDPDVLGRLYDAYLDDDRDRLDREIEASLERSEAFDRELAGFNDALLAGRNAAWAARLAELLDSGDDVFLFAGVAHFIGGDSVLRQLAGRGYIAVQPARPAVAGGVPAHP